MQILGKKIWRNQYFFVTLQENKKKPTPGPSLKGRERKREREGNEK